MGPLLVLITLAAAACRTLAHDRPPLAVIEALPPARTGPLAELERATRQRLDDGESGFLLLDRNEDALRWRIALADSAERSLDLQYYLWYSEPSGRLLMAAVLRAADRGVRVRILVDDIVVTGHDRTVAAVDQHPNVEVRVFNPWERRELGKVLEALTRMNRLNSRMHNKLFVADNRVAICGGRNIGDEYFGLKKKSCFYDLDLLAVGPVARQLSTSFDLYWNAEQTVAGAAFGKARFEELERGREDMRARLAKASSLERFPLERQDWSEQLESLPARLHAGVGRASFDEPGTGRTKEGASVAAIVEAMLGVREELLVMNAYFIPGQSSIDWLADLHDRGIRVGLLTNSLASYDVPAVNSGFKKWRKAVVESGVELHELRHDAAFKARQDTPPVRSKFLGLHAKAFVVDRKLVYVGSHNLDPRSHEINLELGLLVESPSLAEELAGVIEESFSPENSWRVRLDEKGRLYWEAGDERVTKQPTRNFWQRVEDGFFGILPIESQL